MIGIQAYGVHVPFYRMSRAMVAKAWNTAPVSGERTVANYDEDALTMAVSAALDCTRGSDAKKIDAIFFASTSSPYIEKQASSTAAIAVDLPAEAVTTDFGGSLRCSTNALRGAFDAVTSGSFRSVLVCAADLRPCYPNSDKEIAFGDGASALLVGSDNVLAELVGWHTLSDEMLDVWRRDDDRFVRSWEDRFVLDMGFTRVVSETIESALKKCHLEPSEITKAVIPCPSPRQLSVLATKVGFADDQIQNTFFDQIGYLGTASPFVGLAAALAEAKAGDVVLVAAYGSGCNVFVFKVTERAPKFARQFSLTKQLRNKSYVPSYQKYLQWRKTLEVQPPARPDPEKPSAVALWLDNKCGIGMYGSQCRICGTRQYPVQKVCVKCGKKDEYDYYRFADKIGNLTTFCQDNLVYNLNPPTNVVVVDFPEGGRFVGDMTDCEPTEVKIDMPLEMTFRRISDAGGIYNYWWKARPRR